MSLQAFSHLDFLNLALSEADKCTPSSTAFCVGCVIITRLQGSPPVILATSYSRELPGNTHAEANALAKARALSQETLSSMFSTTEKFSLDIDNILSSSDVYTTMEPCSIRTSGLAPCADALIAAKISRCFIGVGEPTDFVNCEGAQRLISAGIEVTWIKGLEERCLEVARKGHVAQ